MKAYMIFPTGLMTSVSQMTKREIAKGLAQGTNPASIKSSTNSKQKDDINSKQGKIKLCKGFKRTRGAKSKVENETKYGLQFLFLSKGKRVGKGNQDLMYNHRAYTV